MHGTLGEGGDGEGGVDAEVRTDDGAVADVKVGVAENAVVAVDDSAFGGVRHGCSADTVRGHGDVEEDFGDGGAGHAAGYQSAQLGEAVGGGDVGGDGVAGGGEHLDKGPVPGAFEAHGEMAVDGLHAEQDERLVGGAKGLEGAQCSPRELRELEPEGS